MDRALEGTYFLITGHIYRTRYDRIVPRRRQRQRYEGKRRDCREQGILIQEKKGVTSSRNGNGEKTKSKRVYVIYSTRN